LHTAELKCCATGGVALRAKGLPSPQRGYTKDAFSLFEHFNPGQTLP